MKLEPWERGVGALARSIGRSAGHISRVLAGKRKAGRALEMELRRRGISLPRKGAVK